jgi:hypothetical protein
MTAYLEALRALLRRKAAPSTFNSADWKAVGPALRRVIEDAQERVRRV